MHEFEITMILTSYDHDDKKIKPYTRGSNHVTTSRAVSLFSNATIVIANVLSRS